jgi:hypothetical protein
MHYLSFLIIIKEKFCYRHEGKIVRLQKKGKIATDHSYVTLRTGVTLLPGSVTHCVNLQSTSSASYFASLFANKIGIMIIAM